MRSKSMVVLCGALMCACTSGEGEDPGRGDRPLRPRMADDGSDTGSLVLRLTLSGFTSDSGGLSGRNLDGLETTATTLDSECTPPGDARPALDGVDGLDNVFGTSLMPVLDLAVPCWASNLTAAHAEGRWALFLLVSGWNGTANDARVRASLVVAADGTSADAAAVTWDATTHQLVLSADGTTPAPAPTGTSSDHFIVRPDSLVGSVERLLDTDAYVRDGVIVFALPERSPVPLFADASGFLLRLNDGLVLAELNADMTAVARGSVSGRIQSTDVVDTMPQFGVCDGTTEATVEAQLLRLLDVRANTNSTSDVCDAISVGFGFEGQPAQLAQNGAALAVAGTNPPLPNPCESIGPICGP